MQPVAKWLDVFVVHSVVSRRNILQCLLTASQIDVAFRSFAKLFWEYAMHQDNCHYQKVSHEYNSMAFLSRIDEESVTSLIALKACIRTDLAKLTTSATRSTMLIHSDVFRNHAISHLKGGSAVHLMDFCSDW